MSQADVVSLEYAEAVLQWYLENGVDEPVSAVPVNRLAERPVLAALAPVEDQRKPAAQAPVVMAGTTELKAEALGLANAAQSLDELKSALMAFEGLAIKKTAMNLVFGTGNPASRVMVIGDAPEAEDDRAGLPFSGEVGALADKMFAAIGLQRQSEDPLASIYMTNVLAWRPPGNRSPTSAEIELSLPFLERHIELVAPKIVFLMGGVAAKSLLASEETIARLRGKSHTVKTLSGKEFPALVTYHPSFLLKTPLKKKEAWEDLQALKALLADPVAS